MHRRRSREGPQVRTHPHNNLVVRVLYGLDPHNNLSNMKKGRFLVIQIVHLECHQQHSFTLKMNQNGGCGFAPDLRTSAVTIIVVTIFIATFQNYHIVSLSRYLLCMRNDIFARHLCYASMIDSPGWRFGLVVTRWLRST